MKKTLIALSTLFFTLSSCHQDPNSSNCNPANGYTEFTLDGELIKICANSTVDASAIIRNYNGTYQRIEIGVNNIDGISPYYSHIHLDITSPSGSGPFILGQEYPFQEVFVGYDTINDGYQFPQFYISIPSNPPDEISCYTTSCDTPPGYSGTVQFSQIDNYVGGRVKGTFSYENLCYHTSDYPPTIISTGHNVTNGTFETTILEIE